MISACLQDALVAVRDLAYDPRRAGVHAGRQPLSLGERFAPMPGEVGHSSARCARVTFDDVDAAAYRGFQRSEKDRILSLLAIRVAEDASERRRA